MAQVTEGEQRGTADPRPAAMDLFTLGLGPMSLCVSDGWRLELVLDTQEGCSTAASSRRAKLLTRYGAVKNCRGRGRQTKSVQEKGLE